MATGWRTWISSRLKNMRDPPPAKLPLGKPYDWTDEVDDAWLYDPPRWGDEGER